MSIFSNAFGTVKKNLSMIFHYRSSAIGFSIVLTVLILGFGAPLIASKGYDYISLIDRFKPPSLTYPFGTDALGRDVFSRVIYGARIALWVGLLVVMIESLIGVGLGIVSGFYGGVVDKLIMALSDIVWSFPAIVLALGVVIVLGPGLNQVIVAIALLSWPSFTRITRAKVQSLVNREFILAARAIGESDFTIMIRYLLPNIMPTVLVLVSLSLPAAILSATALSFLGFGAQPPTPDWGAMLKEGMPQLTIAPWIATIPGVFISITALGFNLLGDGLRDLLDPRLKI